MVLSLGLQLLLVERGFACRGKGQSSWSRFEEESGESREAWILERDHFGFKNKPCFLYPPNLSHCPLPHSPIKPSAVLGKK